MPRRRGKIRIVRDKVNTNKGPEEFAIWIASRSTRSARSDLAHEIATMLRRQFPEHEYPEMNTDRITWLSNQAAELRFPKSPKKKRER